LDVATSGGSSDTGTQSRNEEKHPGVSQFHIGIHMGFHMGCHYFQNAKGQPKQKKPVEAAAD